MVKNVNKRGFRMWKSGKHWLTSGATAGIMVVALGGSPVNADEVPEASVVAEPSTGNPATNLTEEGKPENANQAAFNESESEVTGEAPVTIDHSTLNEAVEAAKAVGVDVIQDPTKVAPTANNAEEVDKSVEAIKAEESAQAEKLNSTAVAHSQAVSNWTDVKNSTVAFNESLSNAHKEAVSAYDAFVKNLDAQTADVLAKHKDAIIKVSEREASKDGSSVEGYLAYIKELAKVGKLNEASIEDYLAKKAEFNKKSTEASNTVKQNASLSASILADNLAKSQSVDAKNASESARVSSANASTSASASTENARRSQSADAVNRAMSLSASTAHQQNADASASIKAKNDSLSASASAETARRSQSADAENARRSTSAELIKNDNVAKSNSVLAFNASQSASASVENARRSNEAKNNTAENARISESVKAHNASLSASASTENARRSTSFANAEAENTRLSNSVKAHNASLSASASTENRRRSESAAAAANTATTSNEAIRRENEANQAYNRRVMEERGLAYTGNYATDKATVDRYNAQLGTESANYLELKRQYDTDYAQYLRDKQAYDQAVADGAAVLRQSLNNVEFRIQANARGVDNDRYGNSIMTATSTRDGSFTFSHDMIDGVKTIGYGRLTGRVNHRYTPNADGSITAYIESIELDNYSYRNVAPNAAVDQNIAFRVLTPGGRVLFEKPHNGNNTFSIDINRTISIGETRNLRPGQSTGWIPVIQIHDDWIEDTHGWGIVSYRNNNTSVPVINIPPKPTPPTEPVRPTATPLEIKPIKPLTPSTPVGFTPVNYTPVTFTPTPPSPVVPVTYTPIPFNPKTGTYTPVTPEVRTFTPESTNWTKVGYEAVPFTPTPFTPTKVVGGIPVKPEFVTPSFVEFIPEGFTPKPYQPKEVPTVPVEPKLNLTKLKAPVSPELKEVPDKPETPEVHYHLNSLNATVEVTKEAKNEDNVAIDGKLVPKNSVNFFYLDVNPLNAHRTTTTSIVFTDHIQDGLELDVEGMVKDNPNYDVAYSKDRVLTFTAKDVELAKANQDLTKSYDLTTPKVIFRTLNDGATYTNTFRLDINGGVTGNVLVEHREEGTNKLLIPRVYDKENVPVGEAFDTGDRKFPTITVDGKTYERVVEHVEGNETGTVTEKDQLVVYYYKLVPSKPNVGSVIVHYEDEEGNPLIGDEVDEKDQEVGKSYDTSDKKIPNITLDGVEYVLVPNKTKGNETGKIPNGTEEVTYVYKRVTPKPKPGGGITTYSNKVKIYTPGRDPKKPRPPHPTTPDQPGSPTPHDNFIQPKKDIVNKDGVSINGKTLLPTSELRYLLTQDFDQYRDMVATKDSIGKGFIYIEDYKDEAIDGKSFKVNSIKAANNDDVSSLYEMRHVLSKDALTGELAELVKASGVSPVGEFYLAVVKDPASFYTNYVQKGLSVTFDVAFKLKEGFVGKVNNQTYQVDFGNGYYSNITENDIPKLESNKDIVLDGEKYDNTIIEFGREFKYLLEGAKLPGSRGESIWQYDAKDDYDQAGDEYLGKYTARASTDITTTKEVVVEVDSKFEKDVTTVEGTVIKAGELVAKGTKLAVDELIKANTDLTSYTTSEHDKENGVVVIKFKPEFLATVKDTSEFGANFELDFKRIAYGEFKNTFNNIVNGGDVVSDTVSSITPKPADPIPPTPPTPTTPPLEVTPPDPAVPEKPILPKTGDAGSTMTLMGILTTIGTLGLVKPRRKK